MIWKRPDLIRQLSTRVDFDEVQRIRIESSKKLAEPNYADLPDLLSQLPLPCETGNTSGRLHVDLSSDCITIGNRTDLTEAQYSSVGRAIRRLCPWRKGPFDLFGIQIDAEWRSNLKWDRIQSALGDLGDRRILDIGCGNGYYMFRAAAQRPKLILGLDPSVQFYYSFELMQYFLRMENLQYERLGFQHLYVFERAFDVALCMGILYHHRSPIEILRDLRQSLDVGGFAIIESQTIPGEGSHALFPEDRYGRSRNIFFLPTRDCLINWVKRAGFKNVELIAHTKVTSDEQRSTEMMKFDSLVESLDPNDNSLTIEGYPAPYRTALRAERQFL